MPKSQRLMELMMEVNRKRRFTARELAEQFGVSRRTILRDLRELEEIGVPLYAEAGPNGGFRILRERLLPPIAFTEEEAAAIFFAYQSLQQYGDLPFDAETKTALQKFYANLPADAKDRIDRMRHRVQFRIPRRPTSSPYLKLLLAAAVQKKRLAIVYDSKSGRRERRIRPIGIYASNGFWYCPAYCYDRGDFRLFRADRIEAAAMAETAGGEEDEAGMSDLHLGNWEAGKSAAALLDAEAELSREGVGAA